MLIPVQALFPQLFLAIFQVIGGLAVGSGLRPLIFERTPRGAFLIIWGLGFGGIPALMGIAFAVAGGVPLLALAGPVVFVGALLCGLIVLPALVSEYGVSTLVSIAIGTLFMLIGFGVGVGLIREREVVGGLLFGGIFGLVGALLCSLGVWALISDKPASNA
jgi:hypothetical protein